MNFTEYQTEARRTNTLLKKLKDPQTPPEEKRRLWFDAINMCAYGLTGEAGESVDALKKLIFHFHAVEEVKQKVKIELGDLLWYIAALADTFDLSIEEIAQANVDKLKSRYPQGFDPERSRNR